MTPATEVAAVYAPPVPRSGHGAPKLLHLQILRAIAASLVVADHAFANFRYFGIPTQTFARPSYLLGDLGVSAFFVLSGLIMVRQSSALFGSRRGPLIFAYRRITRIVPMYWIATLVFVATRGFSANVLSRKQLLLSLAFIPNFYATDIRLMPLLQAGWTLNYEMFFYLLFALALLLPVRAGLVALLVVPEVLVAAGHALSPHTGIAALSNFYTSPLLLLFAHGVLIGFLEKEMSNLPRWHFRVSPAFLLLVPAALLLLFPARIGNIHMQDVLAVYGTLVVLLCTLANYDLPGRVGRLGVLLGDASYSTYLFHLVTNSAVFFWGARLFRHSSSTAIGLLLVVISVCAANVGGLLIHVTLERWIIHFFRDLGPGRKKAAA